MDTYEQFCVSLPGLTPEQAEWCFNLYGSTSPSFHMEVNDDEIVLRDHGMSFDHDDLIAFLQEFLKTWFPNDVITVPYSVTCDKHRSDAFGGGWLVISAESIRSGDVWDAIKTDVAVLQMQSADEGGS